MLAKYIWYACTCMILYVFTIAVGYIHIAIQYMHTCIFNLNVLVMHILVNNWRKTNKILRKHWFADLCVRELQQIKWNKDENETKRKKEEVINVKPRPLKPLSIQSVLDHFSRCVLSYFFRKNACVCVAVNNLSSMKSKLSKLQ